MNYNDPHKNLKTKLDSTIAKTFLTNGAQRMIILILGIFLFSFTFAYIVLRRSLSERKSIRDDGILGFLYQEDNRSELVKTILEYTPEDALDAFRFYQDHVSFGVPLILRGFMNEWEAVKKWKDDEYLLSKIGQEIIEVEVREGDGNDFAFFKDGYKRTKMMYKKFLSLYTNDNLPEKYYWAEQKLPAALKEDLMKFDFAKFMYLEEINVWQGAVGTVSLPHMDGRDNFLCQITGYKDLVIVAPTQTANLYVDPSDDWPSNYSPVNFFEPDLDKHPAFNDVNLKFNVRINAGDVIYIPSFWWHHIKSSKGKNIAVNYWFTNNYMVNLLMEYVQAL